MIRQTPFPPAPPRGARRKRICNAPRLALGLLVTSAAVALPACGDLFGSRERVFGNIDFDHRDFHIPETATAGVPLRLVIWTMGGGCHEGGGTEVDVDGLSAVVTPYDYVRSGGGGDCPSLLAHFDHGTTVVFEEPGDAEIVLRYSTGGGSHNTSGRKASSVKVSPAR